MRAREQAPECGHVVLTHVCAYAMPAWRVPERERVRLHKRVRAWARTRASDLGAAVPPPPLCAHVGQRAHAQRATRVGAGAVHELALELPVALLVGRFRVATAVTISVAVAAAALGAKAMGRAGRVTGAVPCPAARLRHGARRGWRHAPRVRRHVWRSVQARVCTCVCVCTRVNYLKSSRRPPSARTPPAGMRRAPGEFLCCEATTAASIALPSAPIRSSAERSALTSGLDAVGLRATGFWPCEGAPGRASRAACVDRARGRTGERARRTMSMLPRAATLATFLESGE